MTDLVHLRDAMADDAEQVASIWHRGWQDGHLGHVSQRVADERTLASFRLRAPTRIGDTRVAELDGVVVGFVMVAENEVEQVYLLAEHRGAGLADLLMADAEARIATAGHELAWLAVVAGNARARRFYERRGWVDGGLVVYEAATIDGTIVVPSHRYEKVLV
ncbi:MAG: GNAT family N-acetyltransferase [Actinomycetota bacterium]